VAEVQLDGPAQGNTTVTITSNSSNVSTSNATVPDGQTSADVIVTPQSEGEASLTAQLGAGPPLTLTPPLKVGSTTRTAVPSTVSLAPATVNPGQGSIGTVVMDFTAEPGGATVALASDNPKVQVPAQVIVPADQCAATFAVTTQADAAGTADITATVAAITKNALLTIAMPQTQPTPPVTTPGPTGQRAAGLKKCKRKPKAKRKKCRKRAKRLPV
jgi:hypothetical protein